MIAAIADTHAVLWYSFRHPRLSVGAKAFIEAAIQRREQIGVSSISLVEMVYLIEKNRIPPESLTAVAQEFALASSPFVEIPIDLPITRALTRVDVTQVPDMPDRIIAATALHLNVPVISRDGKIRLSSVPTIW